MKTLKNFLAPRMVGQRFADHGIPLEVLKDLAVLEEMIVEVAKWHYLNEHSDRKRSPKGFTDNIALKLTEIGKGSAIANIEVAVESSGFGFPEANEIYFDKARDSIIGAIDAAENQGPITDHLPEKFLAYFDRMGRSLRDDEAILFHPTQASRPATLNKTTRRTLTRASTSVKEFTDDIVLRGRIPEADQDRGHFTLQSHDGTRLRGPLDPQHTATIIEAFGKYAEDVKVAVTGIATSNRNGKIQRLESVEHVVLLDPNDIGGRLDEFRSLKHGWLNGEGLALPAKGLDQLTAKFEYFFPDNLPAPFLYPTVTGGVQAEWKIDEHDVTLNVALQNLVGQWQDLNLSTDEEVEKELDLSLPADWQWMIEQVQGMKESK